MTAGTLSFDQIPPLAGGWDPDSYYLWGANEQNMHVKPGGSLHGDGMAGPHGPTQGVAHEQYIGINTMSISNSNDAQFTDMATKLAAGCDVVVPTFHGKYSLGTGIGARMDPDVWRRIQRSIIEGIIGLAGAAGTVHIPAGTYWPDCRTQVDVGGRTASICDGAYAARLNEHSDGTHRLVDVGSLQKIVSLLAGS